MKTPTETAVAPRRILIVEDEAVIAMDMAQQLRDFGYDVVGVAASGDRARRLVAERQPDLIMMDIVIKGRSDGIETARQIRGDRDIPVVFLTAHGDDKTLERAKSAAPLGYLIKPFRPSELRATIEIALHNQALERRVRESEHWLMKTLHCIGDGIIASDAEGAIRFMNPVAEALTGTSETRARGRQARDVFQLQGETGEAPPPDLLAQALMGNECTPLVRALLHTPAGEPRLYVDAGAAPIRDDDGRLLGSVLVFRDVTQRRLDEQELQRWREHLEALVRERTAELESAKREAERANRTKSEFLSSISHELRTPLSAVLGFSQLLATEDLGERASGYLGQIGQAGNLLLHLIDDLIDFSKVNAGRLIVTLSPVDLGEATTQAVHMVHSLAASRGIVPTIDLPAQRLLVSADPTRLGQVLINLLSNAIKYNHQRGEVGVRCAAHGPDRARVTVTDNGFGIAPEKQGLLFHAFERLGAETGAVTGAGIGLAFSKRLAEMMQGELGFESKPGVGSSFWIELKRCEAADR